MRPCALHIVVAVSPAPAAALGRERRYAVREGAGAGAADIGEKVDPSGFARKRVQRVLGGHDIVCVTGRCGGSGRTGATCVSVLYAHGCLWPGAREWPESERATMSAHPRKRVHPRTRMGSMRMRTVEHSVRFPRVLGALKWRNAACTHALPVAGSIHEPSAPSPHRSGGL